MKVISSIFLVVFFGGMLALGLFLAGTTNLPFFWIVMGTQLAVSMLMVITMSSDLLMERYKPRGKDQDPAAQKGLSILLLLLMIIAALDVGRWHISAVPVPLQAVAAILHLLGWLLCYWAVYTNQFFSSAIRLQPDRGQFVVMNGPYRFIRHPGYSGAAILMLAEPIALGSWLAVVPAIALASYIAYRSLLEDKILGEGLPGYAEYKDKVRYRWIPGVW